jgi:hypothetical protein
MFLGARGAAEYHRIVKSKRSKSDVLFASATPFAYRDNTAYDCRKYFRLDKIRIKAGEATRNIRHMQNEQLFVDAGQGFG